MACPDRLSQWSQEVSTAFAHLSKAQRVGLALWSAGIALAGAVGIDHVSALLALVLRQSEQTVFQRLREWYLDSSQKSGKRRSEWDVTLCFAPLLRWILGEWQGEKRLALVLDATTLGERWTVLCISVVVQQCAIPVAWKVLPKHGKGSWRPHWEGLLQALHEAVPGEWHVLVLADRGWYARWLYTAMCECGWHPFLRINLQVKAREVGGQEFDWMTRWVPAPGCQFLGVMECFVERRARLRATVLMRWEPGYEHPWIILTDLDPDQARISWYGMRTWVEGGFKDFKRGLWGWQHTKMKRASSVERLWLALSLAQLWMMRVGSQAEKQQQEKPPALLPPHHPASRKRKRPDDQPPVRRLSCVVRGRLVILAALVAGQPLPMGRLVANPWPQTITAPQKQTKASILNRKERRRKQRSRARKRARLQRASD